MAKITGTNRKNKLIGTAGNDLIRGLGGDDTIKGGSGNDKIDGATGNDKLYGGKGNDQIKGGDGNDQLYGEAGDDTLNGEAGDDTLVGGLGVDTMNGGDGNDTIVAGPGADTIDGGADTMVVDFDVGYAGGDWLSYADATSGVTVDLAFNIFAGGALGDSVTGIEHVLGSSFADVLYADTVNGGILDGGAGSDFISTVGGGDFWLIRGGLGYDVLQCGAGSQDWAQVQYDKGLDRIEGFDPDPFSDNDFLYVSAAEFNLATASANFLGAGELEVGTNHQATAASTRLIFETDTRILWADKDGSGSDYSSVAIAVIDDIATIAAGDFWVIV